MTSGTDPREPANPQTEGRARWEVRVVEGPPHGDLYELEQDTFFNVIDRRNGRAVKTFTGHYDASFTTSGTWGEGCSSGVQTVVIDEEGRCAFALHFNRRVDKFRLRPEQPPEDPALPWRLAGLPLPQLPTTVDGFVVDEGADFDSLLRRVAEGWVPADAASSYRQLPASWICDLYLRLNGLPTGTRLAAELARALTHDDSRRGVGLWFFRRLPCAEGSERILELVRSRGAAEALHTSSVKYGTEGWMEVAPIDVFAEILNGGNLDDVGISVLQMCGEAVLVPTTYCEERHVEAIARYDPAWVARNATSVVGACPGRLGLLLSTLYRAGHNDLVVTAGVALARHPGVDRRALEAWLERPRAGVDIEQIRRAL